MLHRGKRHSPPGGLQVRHHGSVLLLSWRHVGAWLSGRRHGGALPWKSRHDGARVCRQHHGGSLPLSWRHVSAGLSRRLHGGALPWRKARFVGGTTLVFSHRAGATLAHGYLGSATVSLCPGGRAATAHVHVGGTIVVFCH